MGEEDESPKQKTSKKENNNEEQDNAEVNDWSGYALCDFRTDDSLGV